VADVPPQQLRIGMGDELVHALQDQYYQSRLRDCAASPERSLGLRASGAEGQATLVQMS